MAEIAELQRCHPAWSHWMEDRDPNTTSADELLELLRTAPTSFAKGLIYGKLRLRMELAATTGRWF